MKKLIEYYNKNYGDKFINLEYPKTKKDIYRAYSYIKDFYESNSSIYEYDTELEELLNFTELPKPKGINETVLYYQCRDWIGDEMILIENIKEEDIVLVDMYEEPNLCKYKITLDMDIDDKFFSHAAYINTNLDYDSSDTYLHSEYHYKETGELVEKSQSGEQIIEGEEVFEAIYVTGNSYLEISDDFEPSATLNMIKFPDKTFMEIIFQDFPQERLEIIKNLKVKVVLRKYPANTKIHILDEKDTFYDILPLIYDGYGFVKKEIPLQWEIDDCIENGFPIPIYNYITPVGRIRISLTEKEIFFEEINARVTEEGYYEIS